MLGNDGMLIKGSTRATSVCVTKAYQKERPPAGISQLGRIADPYSEGHPW